MTLRALLLDRLGRLSRRAPPFRGRARLQRTVQRGLFGGGAPSDLEVEVGGVAWALDLNELIQFRLFWDGGHDGHVLAWLEAEARRHAEPVVWDVGANIGAIALPLARRVPGARVEAFEPSPAVFAKLARHAQMNPRLAVHARPLALGEHDGTLPFYASAEPGNAGVGSLYLAHNTVPRAVEVRVARGDSLVASGEVPAPQVVKIDVEGFEPEALRGLADTLRTHRPALCVESSAYRLDGRGLPREAIVTTLEGLGYGVAVIEGGRERPLRAADLATNFDLAARPA